MGTFVVMSLLIMAVLPAVRGQSAMSASVAASTLTASLPTPNRAIDIVFALDRSGSVGSDNYIKIIDFVKAVLSHFSVSPTTTRVAVVSFGSSAKVDFDLLRSSSNNNNKCELLRTYIPKIKNTGGGTNTIGALNHAFRLLTTSGVRRYSTKVVFTITDGRWNVGGDPVNEVRKLQNMGVYMYAFGIGAWGINSYKLRGLGTKDSGGHKYVYLCLNFSVLSQVAKRLRGDFHTQSYLSTTYCPLGCRTGCQCDVYGGRYSCVCPKGYNCNSYYKRNPTKCPLNTYKDTVGPGSCKNCPSNSVTSRTGATSKTECRCKSGYYQVGNPIRSCKRVTCSKPSYDSTAVRAVSGCGTWTYSGNRCSLDCQSGYEPLSGTKLLICQNTGRWSATPLSCKKITCPILTAPQDGSISTCGNRFGDTCTFQCDYSFKLSGSATATCTAARSWSHPTPRCSKLSCKNSEIADPSPNGVRACPGSYTEVGHSCSVTCNTGYQPKGPQVSTCREANGVAGWDSRPQACQVDKCTPLTDPSDGTVSPVLCKTSPDYNTQCTYGCNKQYTLHGPTSKTCEPGGVWSSTGVNTCRDEMDPTFSNCPGDITSVAPSQKTEAEVSWLVPTATDNSGSTPTVDVDITTSLGPVNFLQRTPPIWFQEGQYTATYTATDQAGNTATCDFSIHVQVTRCSQVGTPANGKTTPDLCGVLRGSRCGFSCDSGYNRVGADESTCQDDGSWSSPAPTCEVVHCPSLSAQPHTTMSGCYGTSSEPYGKACHFDCNAGYTIKRGTRSRQCMADGSWSGTELECEVETCTGLSIPPNGAISPMTCTSESNYGTICHLSCDVGYRTSGPTEQTCSPGGLWSDQGKPTTCIDTQAPTFTNCPPDQTVYAGLRETSATATWTVPTATDNSGFTPTVTRVEGNGPGSTFAEGTHSIKYTAVDSAGRNSDCSFRITVKAVYCSTLNAPSSGRIMCNQNDRRYGTTCQFQCNLGYQLVGNHTSSCEKDPSNVGFWTTSAPTCEIVTCPNLNAPAHGTKSGCNNAQEDYNTVCTFYCNKGSSPKASIKRTCQQNGKWSGSDLMCTIDTCTALSPIQHGAINPSFCTSNPAYNDVCTYSCETGYTLAGSQINKCLDGGRWQNNGSVSCQDITKPVFHGCPSDIYVTADGGEGSVNVTWSPPSATDLTGTAPAVTSTGVKTIFNEGSHHVTYTAEDAAGNIAKCQFTVVVTVHRCKSLPPPAFGQFVSTCNNLRGSSCSMECHTGYRLIGSATRTCVVTNNGTTSYWDGVETKCEIFRCSPLSRPSHGTITPTSCTVQPVAGTQCTFHCMSGFELQNGVNATECNATGHWSPSASSTPSCRDIQPPVFTSCPSDVYREPGAGLGTVLVNWDKPRATDNTAVAITVSPIGTEPPSDFTVGTHVVTYTATDSAGLTATCSFSVIVRDNEKPNITCPSDIEEQTSSPPIAVTWVVPVATDNSGTTPTVTSLSKSPGDNFEFGPEYITYEAIDGSGNRATCTFRVLIKSTDCPSLNAPANGALVCGFWFFGTYCDPNCEENSDFPAGYHPSTHFCDTSGTWITGLGRDARPARLPIPDCSESSSPNAIKQGTVYFYYSGNCSDPAVQQQIKDNFIHVITTQYALVCRFALQRDPTSGGCSIANVHVTCGTRSKRSLWQSLSRMVRQTSDDEVGLDFTLTVAPGNTTANETASDSLGSTLATMESVFEGLKNATDSGELQLEVGGETLGAVPDSLQEGEVVLQCPTGTAWNNDTNKCAGCPSGFYFDEGNNTCVDCPLGSYQDQHNQLSCRMCPNGTWTEDIGSRNDTYCKELCEAGWHSSTRVQPCTECSLGTYQPDTGSTSCISCPSSQTTNATSATSSTFCFDRCQAGHFSSNGLAPCTPCPRGEYQFAQQSTSCLQCPLGYTTASEASESSADCFNIDDCSTSPCVNNGTCSDRINAYLCQCLDGFEGNNCEIDVDECSSSPCVNGTCTDEIDGYTCVCYPGFTGEDCSTDIDDCEANPCSNGAECIDRVNSFSCDCLSGYSGVLCDVDVNECEPSPCENNATCSDLVASYACICNPGYTGTHCEENINDCDASPCANGGTCVDGVNSYTCLCNEGFTGDDCEVNVNDCAATPCANNGTCVNGVSGYSCECASGYAGTNCTEDFEECSSSPCQNDGTCDDLFDSYTCTCNQGYTGVNCEAEIDHCAASPCSNGATCMDKYLDFECLCSPGYEGLNCEVEINECASSPCVNNGSCYDQVDGYICLCTDEYTGVNCEARFSPCESTPCHNGATCTDDYPDYDCICPTGFGGSTCSINLPECASGPCNNGGTCVDGIGNFSCSCPSGFEGDLCEAQINECERAGCENSGTCTDTYGGFDCDCQLDYNGTRCEVNIDDCATHGCTNGSECVDGIATYACDCLSGFTGPTCSEDVDECSSNPCLNALDCNNLVDDYMCECQDGFTGKNCEINIDDCANVTCHNAGECIDGVAGFICNCPDGFSGSLCEIDTDECASDPCQSSGTCMDGVNSYICQCRTGYTGTNCELDIDECITSPCENAAPCTNTHGDYSCACLSGYEGKDCDGNIDDCQGHACQNNGTCVDQLNDYMCLCAAGFTGDRCDSDVNDCDFNSCQNGGTCVDGINSVTCQCAHGYHGEFCEIETDDCAALPCQNGGSCTDIGSDYQCDCMMGFNGKDCEINIDDCVGHMCKNGAVCDDRIGNYSCTCKPSFNGSYCETELSSDFDLVFDGSVDGYSSVSYNIPDMTAVTVSIWMQTTDRSNYGTAFSYALSEEVGSDNALTISDYTAFTVYVNGEAAYSNHGIQDDNWHHIAVTWTNTSGQWKLFDNGLLVDGGSGLDVGSTISGGGLAVVGQEQDYLGGGFSPDEAFIGSLHGLNWWSRALSDSEITELATSCNHSLRGDVLTWADFQLNVEGDTNITTQSLCDDTKECLSSPCENNATCTDYFGGYRCTCLPGYTGVHCEDNIDECLGTTCGNGGTCVDLVNDFYCSCLPAFHGKTCALDVATCSPNPCEHGGNCTDSGGGTYSCSCSPGYTGQDCEVDVDECSSGPCTNGGTCVDMVNDYYCDCLNGFFGQNCDGEVDYCDPNLCQHGGTCQPITNDYSCTCSTGYMGYNCEIDIDECEGVVCMNNGTCEDGIAAYTCRCPAGFTGSHCGTNIDDCQGRPCENGGTCVDGVASYSCDCPAMFTGERCQLVILPNLPETTEPYVSTPQTPTPSFQSTTPDTGGMPAQDSVTAQRVPIIAGSVVGAIVVIAVAVLGWVFCRSSPAASKVSGLKYVRPASPKVGVVDDSMVLAQLSRSDRVFVPVRAQENPYFIVED